MSARLRTAVAGGVFSQEGSVQRSGSVPAKRDVLQRMAGPYRLLLPALKALAQDRFARQHMDDILLHLAGRVGEAGRYAK